MAWTVEMHEDFEAEFNAFSENVQDELLAKALMLEKFGPTLGRPHVDTLNSSKYTNMKEIRFDADNGVWRVAFAFDPKRKAILLTGGSKKGKNERQFYIKLIQLAESRYEQHLKKSKQVKDKDHGNSNSKSAGRVSKGQARKNKGKGR